MVSIGVLLLMLAVYLLLSRQLIGTALIQEQHELTQDLTRAKNAILNELEQLELTTLDWAVFDESYEFMLGQNPRYAERNLTNNLEILNLEFFLMQKSDQVVLSRQRVLDSIYLVPPTVYQDFLKPWNWLWSQSHRKLQRMTPYSMTTGVVAWGETLYLAARAPIVSSSVDSPNVGQLTMIRLLDEAVLKKLSALTQLKILVLQQSLDQIKPSLKPVVTELSSGQHQVTQRSSETLLKGYTWLFDTRIDMMTENTTKKVLLLEVQDNRQIYAQAKAAANQLAWLLLLFGVLVTAFIVGLLEFGLMSRLSGLRRELGQIATSGDISHRLSVRGQDELEQLALQINSSLSRVEDTQIKSVQLEARLERIRSTELAASLEETRLELFERLARIAEFRDNETGLHTSRVGEVSYALAQELGLSQEECERLRYASRLHDIGKIAIPDSILFKPSVLESHEWTLMQTHATLGGQMLEGSGSPLLEMARLIATTHHERWNGSGYPNGLRGEEIPLLGRIVGVADTLDALTSPRPYKPAWEFQDALDEISAHSGHLFDAKVVAALQKIAPHLHVKEPDEAAS
jgi:HD-GYP domain-containing protein (c-di-GMP phosphodiesterase class II)/sensor domain CHASE-containing protein